MPRTNFVTPFYPSATGGPRGSCAWAERPTSFNNVGDTLKISDRGNAEHSWNGSAWVLLTGYTNPVDSVARYSPVILAQNATVPVILGNKSTGGISGTAGATLGAFTLDTALPVIYPSAWMFLPAGAVVGGAAGFYYCTFSSTTVGICYTNYVSPDTTAFEPSVPTGTLTKATGAAATWTATASADIALVNITVPAGIMGASGKARMSLVLSTTNSSNAKLVKASFGALAFLSSSTTTTLGEWIVREVANVTAAKQITSPLISVGPGTTGVALRGTVDTAAAVALKVFGQLHTTDAGAGYIILESYTVEVLSGA